eukprot:CAMPEP_0184668082 /NCGR_PEP_ID=MMETSP0308-20130426/70667_1 /TAXON_ID=38269 /ORGANISM="Gloeochaete witrockiana, Strain SAG 46.84" /LENGTH=104 /DNA_ID=CAMNT_0027113621 /DNA_START=162 /DNA_END=474 /DNA_ORIENTATION=+
MAVVGREEKWNEEEEDEGVSIGGVPAGPFWSLIVTKKDEGADAVSCKGFLPWDGRVSRKLWLVVLATVEDDACWLDADTPKKEDPGRSQSEDGWRPKIGLGQYE